VGWDLIVGSFFWVNACYNVDKTLSQFDKFQYLHGTLIYSGGCLKNIL
jgi:hypothetical protein